MHASKFTSFLVCLLFSVTSLWAQGQGGGGAGAQSGGGNTNTGNTGNQSSGNQSRQQSNEDTFRGNRNTNTNDPFGNNNSDPFGASMRPLFLQGLVVTSDGMPLSALVVVQRVCNGEVIPEGYTDTKGRFSFQVGGDASMQISDASASGARFGQGGTMTGGSGYLGPGVRQLGLGRYDLSSCILRAEMPGYRSNNLQLGMHGSMEKNDVGTIVLQRLDGVVGDTVSATTLRAPKNALKAYKSGIKEVRKKNPKFNKAQVQFEKAVAEYPEFAVAWAWLGDSRLKQKDLEGAYEAYTKSTEADPKYLRPYLPLMKMSLTNQDWEALESQCGAYLQLNPNAANIQVLLAMAAVNNNNLEKAEEVAMGLQSSEDKNDSLKSYEILGLVHEKRADFNKAAMSYRSFIEGAPEAANSTYFKRRLHEWEVLGVIEPVAKQAQVSP